MNVLRITPHYYFETTYWPSRFDPMGGMQVQITHLSEWLADHGVWQDVLTTGFPGIPRKWNTRPNLTVHKVNFCTLPIRSRYTGTLFLDQSWFAGVVKWLLRHGRKRDYDVIHVHASGVAWPLRAAGLAKKYLRKPVVLTIHCSRNFTYHPMNRWDAMVNERIKRLELYAMAFSEKIVLLTRKRGELYENLIDKDKLVEIGDCVAPHHLSHPVRCAECASLSERFGGGKTVAFLGRIAHEKGWSTFVRVARELADRIRPIRFIVCGDGPQRHLLEAEIERFGLRDIFHITGFISNKRVPCYLQRADLLILPSIHEEFGGSLLEATAAGVPVIATRNGGPAEIFSHGCSAILRDPDDIGGITEDACRILTDEQMRNALLRNAAVEVLEKFLPQKIYTRYLDLYEQFRR